MTSAPVEGNRVCAAAAVHIAHNRAVVKRDGLISASPVMSPVMIAPPSVKSSAPAPP